MPVLQQLQVPSRLHFDDALPTDCWTLAQGDSPSILRSGESGVDLGALYIWLQITRNLHSGGDTLQRPSPITYLLDNGRRLDVKETIWYSITSLRMDSNGTSNPPLLQDRLEAATTEHMMREPPRVTEEAGTIATVPSRPVSPCSSQGSWVMNPEDGGWDGLGLDSQTPWLASPREEFRPLPLTNEHGPSQQGQQRSPVVSPVSSLLRSWARIPPSNIAAEYPASPSPSPSASPSAPCSPGSVRSIVNDEQAGEGLVGLARDELCFAEAGDNPSAAEAPTGNAAIGDGATATATATSTGDAAAGRGEVSPHEGEGEKGGRPKASQALRIILDKTDSKEGDEKARQCREGKEPEERSIKERSTQEVNAGSRTSRRMGEDGDGDGDGAPDDAGGGAAFEESRQVVSAETDHYSEADRVVIGAFCVEGGRGDIEKAVAIFSDSSDVQDIPLQQDTQDSDADADAKAKVEGTQVEMRDPLPDLLVTTSESSWPCAPSRRLPSTPSRSPIPENTDVGTDSATDETPTVAAAACNSSILSTSDTDIPQLMEYDCRERPLAPRTLTKMDPEASVSEEYHARGQMDSLWNWTGIITAAKMGVIPIIVCAALAALSSQTTSSASDNGAGRSSGGGGGGGSRGGGGGGTRSSSRRPVGGGGSSACFPSCSMRGCRSLYGGMPLPHCVAPSVMMVA